MTTKLHSEPFGVDARTFTLFCPTTFLKTAVWLNEFAISLNGTRSGARKLTLMLCCMVIQEMISVLASVIPSSDNYCKVDLVIFHYFVVQLKNKKMIN